MSFTARHGPGERYGGAGSAAVRRARRRHDPRWGPPLRRRDPVLALAPSAYYAYLAIHILSAVIWVGGDVTLTVLGIVFERRGEGETLGALGRMGAWIGTRVYTPTLVVTLVFGIILMQKGNFDWGQFWVILRSSGGRSPRSSGSASSARSSAASTRPHARTDRTRPRSRCA